MKNSEKHKNSYNISSLIGWLLGGLSLLNLIEDLTPLKLLGKLRKWMEAYSLAIDRIGDFLFGWIKYEWIGINTIETHALVIISVVVAASFRAEYKINKEQGEKFIYALLLSLGPAATVYLLFAFIPALLLPNWFGIAGAIIGFLIICLELFESDKKDREIASRAIIIRELRGVAIVFMLLVVLNYSVFE